MRRRYSVEDDGIELAEDLAWLSSPNTGYASDTVDSEQLAVCLGDLAVPVWFSWCGTKEDAKFSAITGSGPTSQANAMFYSCARELVLELCAEIRRLRNT